MERLQADVESLNVEVKRLREELRHTEKTRDIAEKLASGLASTAEEAREAAQKAHDLLRRRVIAVAAGLTLWALVVAYFAVYAHEIYRNHCYPAAAIVAGHPVDEPSYCGLFPGTGRHDHKE